MTSSWLSSVRRILRLYKKFLCIDPVYDEILANVRGRIWKQLTWFNESLEEGLKLAVPLRHFVADTMYSDMQYGWMVSENTLYVVVREVCQTICEKYADEVMTSPSNQDGWRQLADGFWSTGVEISPAVLLLLMASMWLSERRISLARYIIIYDFYDFVSSEA